MNLIFTCIWIALAAIFCIGVWFFLGPDKAIAWGNAYLIEKSLSTDNLFVFSLIFTSFAVTPQMQKKLLNWGIIGAIVFRGTLILAGSALINSFHWVLYLFGAFLIFTSVKIIGACDESGGASAESGGTDRLSRFIQQLGLNRFLTCLLIIEISDVIFALDSIPATLAITQDPFIVFTSNLFAILGLRSLYFVLVDLLARFENLKYGVSATLAFIGIKILISKFYEIPIAASLLITALLLGASILSSFLKEGVSDAKQID